MKSNHYKKAGRRVAGSWGRTGSKELKRAANKSTRREKPDLETILEETGANSEFDLLVFMGD